MTEEKKKLSRKERRALALLKRKELRVQILEYMQKAIPRCSNNGMLDMEKWAEEGERYCLNLIKIKNKPQEAEMIRKVVRDVVEFISTGLDAYLKIKKGEVGG